MRIAFLGNGAFGVPTLYALARSTHEVISVITRQDRPAGRGRKLLPSPPKTAAMELGISVVEIKDMKSPETEASLRALDAEVWVVVAFPIIPENLLDIPPQGIVNLHASLLPRYRGAAPVQWALIRGETATGITTFFIDADVDTGAICLQREVPIGREETAGELSERLAAIGAGLMVETIDLVGAGTAPRIVQDTQQATPAPKLSKADGELDWRLPAEEVVNRVRGLNPWPGGYTHIGQERILVLRVRRMVEEKVVSETVESPPPGTVWGFLEDGSPVVVAGDGEAVALLELQRAGKRAVAGAELARGLHWKGGEKFRLPQVDENAAEQGKRMERG